MWVMGQLSVRDGAVPGTKSQTSVKFVGFEDEGSEVLEAVMCGVGRLSICGCSCDVWGGTVMYA